MAGSEATLGETQGHRAQQPQCHSVSQQKVHVSMTYTYSSDVTMIPTFNLYLQLQRPNDTYCLTNYYVLMHYIVTATITSL